MTDTTKDIIVLYEYIVIKT